MIPTDTTKALLASLVQLATTDSELAQMEAAHIQMLAVKNGVDPGEFDRICAQPEYYVSRSPISFVDKRDFLAHLIAFVSFDLRIANEELDYCVEKARTMGLNTDSVKGIFDRIKANGGTLALEEIKAGIS